MISDNGQNVVRMIRFEKLHFEGFDVYWAGDAPGAPGSYCFGSGDGSLLFTKPGCSEESRVNHLVRSGEAVNEVAFLHDWLAVSTRGEVVFANKNGRKLTLPGGAHGVVATGGAVDSFVAPMSIRGILWANL